MEIVFIICGVLGALGLIVGSGMFLRWFNKQIGRYFLRFATEDQKRALTGATVLFKEGRLSKYDTDPGIFIKAKLLDKALESMNSYVVTTFPSARRRVHELVVLPVQPDVFAGRFTVSGPAFQEAPNEIAQRVITDLVMPHVRQNILVHNLNFGVAVASNEQAFNIFLCASTDKSTYCYPPERLFGVTRTEFDRCVTAPKTGLALVSDGFTYGELFGNSLYLYPQFGDLTGVKLALLKRILEHCGAELDVDKLIADVLATVPDGAAEPLATPISIFDEGFTARRKALVRGLTIGVLGTAVRSHIHVKDGNGYLCRPYHDEMFHVLHHARPVGGVPSGLGLPITDSEGLILGELIDSTLYTYKAYLKLSSRAEAEAYVRFLTLARDEIMVERSPLVDATHNDRFAEACVTQVRTYAKMPTDPIKLTKASEAAEKQLKTLLSETFRARWEEMNLGTAHETRFGKEFDDLFRISKVRDITVSDSQIVVETTTLFCRDPRDNVLHQIGEFQIVLPFSGEVRFWNKAGPIDLGGGVKMHAPHVNSQGTACLGNTKDQFPALIRSREYASAVNLAILFLESCNVNDSWGKTISSFPVAIDQHPPGAS